MGRWVPDAHGRLMAAATELYAERGFEQTTVAEIAERAGVTERTFFRYFTDKREVLFAGAAGLEKVAVDAIAASPPASPVALAMAGTTAIAAELTDHRHSRKRAAAIASDTALQERELLKMARMTTAIADALVARGVDATPARLAAETSTTVFRVAFDRWVALPERAAGTLLERSAEVRSELQGIAAG